MKRRLLIPKVGLLQYHIPISFGKLNTQFAIKDEKLIQKRKPINILTYHKIKTLLLIKRTFNKLREILARTNKHDIELTKLLIQEIESVGKNKGAETYYIYYDPTYYPDSKSSEDFNKQLIKQLFIDNGRKVLPFINWANDPNGNYFIPDDNYHPNSNITAEIAKQFVEKFGEEILHTVDIN